MIRELVDAGPASECLSVISLGGFVASAQFNDLLGVLARARRLLLLPNNDFVYSQWDNAEEAIRDIDGFARTLEEGRLPPRRDLSILFAPTGSIQEVSARSGWGDEFLTVAEAFDRAEASAYVR